MALTIKDKYNLIDLSKVPADVKKELEAIKADTENFSDPDLVDAFKGNFEALYDIVESNHPGAIKKGKVTVVKKPQKKKKVIKKKPAAKPKPAPKEGDEVSQCKKVLQDANYSVTRKVEKGKRKVIRKPRQDRAIVKDKVEDTMTTITKDLESSEEKQDENKDRLAVLEEIKRLLTKILQSLDKLANDGSIEDLRAIRDLLKKMAP